MPGLSQKTKQEIKMFVKKNVKLKRGLGIIPNSQKKLFFTLEILAESRALGTSYHKCLDKNILDVYNYSILVNRYIWIMYKSCT